MYNHKSIEKKWQKIWEKTKAFKTGNISTKKYYVLDMFPYPSGSGLHVGHPEGYTATDIIARYKRLKGFDVLHPIGWDAFGLPAEQYAIKTNNHPKEFTNENINNFRRQLKMLGFSFDYDKEVNTTDPAFYKWTQWIFGQMFKKGLAEIRDIEVNWCEKLGTVLANEEVLTLEDGSKVSERGEFPVVKKPMKQWVLKITTYADKLLDGLNDLDWTVGLKSLQQNWIKNPDGSLHLKDWVFARQRYWGEPFPIIYDKDNQPILIDDLVVLPEMQKITPSGTGESPLVNNKEWVHFKKNGKEYRRETNTMPQWAGSSWYYLAYILKNDDGSYTSLDSEEAKKRFKKWLPVDLYVGGQEHAVLHLLYARFWHKVLFDLGIVPASEPFQKVVNQGMILGIDGHKMSKSRGNIIKPDDIVSNYGADTLRLYEMFMGPLVDTKPWSEESIQGIRRWLERVVRMFEFPIVKDNLESEFNLFVRDVTKDIEDIKHNLAISKMMIFVNAVYKTKKISLNHAIGFLIILSTFAPHIAEEFLEKFKTKQIKDQRWPEFDETKIKTSIHTIVIQVNGKLRGKIEYITIPSKDEILKDAKVHKNVAKFLQKGNIIKEIYVPKKVINFIVA